MCIKTLLERYYEQEENKRTVDRFRTYALEHHQDLSGEEFMVFWLCVRHQESVSIREDRLITMDWLIALMTEYKLI